MNYTTTTTIGLDALIASVQTDLYNYIGTRWSGTINGYGRVSKNKRADRGEVAEWYLGDNEYQEVYFDDEFSGSFFFIDADKHETEDEHAYSASVKCVFMVDLKQVLPNETERSDAKARRDIVECLRKIAYGRYSITGIETGIDTIFQGLDQSDLKFMDIHPQHCFAVNLKILYYLKDQCN